jgi:hypothetical protein
LKAARCQPSSLSSDILVSKFAFTFNLYPYNTAEGAKAYTTSFEVPKSNGEVVENWIH